MQVQSDGAASLAMDVDDLKRKATRFQESPDGDKRVLDALVPLREKVQHLEAKMECFEERLPRRPFGEEVKEIQSSIELQAELEQFKERMRRQLLEFRETIATINTRPPGVPTDLSWEAVSERVAFAG